jgi:membrane associated rhomboid family serine protease
MFALRKIGNSSNRIVSVSNQLFKKHHFQPGRQRHISTKLLLKDNDATKNIVLYGTMIINIGVWGCWQLTNNDFQFRQFMNENFTVSSYGIFDYKRYHTLITSCFSHQDIAHLFFNMIAFYSFGLNSISVLGSAGFVALYVGGGALSSLCQAAWPYVIPRSWPASRNYSKSSPGLGASGGVNAVVMFNILSFPASTVMLWGVLPIPGIMFGLGYIGIDAYNLYMGDGQVGNAAHLAGAAVGGLLYLWRKRRIVRFRR